MKGFFTFVFFLLVSVEGEPFKDNDKQILKHVVNELRNLRKNYEEIIDENKMYKSELKEMRENYEEMASENKMMKTELQEMKQEWQSFCQNQSDAVGFYAYVSEQTIITEGSILIFNSIITNAGNAYSGVTGTFTAPVNGLYTFTSSFLSYDRSTDLEIRVNDVIRCRAHGYNDAGWENTGACSAVVELMTGDLVNVKLRENHGDYGGGVMGGQYTGFSSVLHYVL